MSEQDHAVRLLQALGDPTRLRLVAALLEQPACVEELAERLGLSAPTISHHLGKLDQAGLLNRRREQYYTVCEARPGPLERRLRELVAMASDQPAAETQRLEQYRRRILDTFFSDGRLRQLPAQRKKRQVVLAAIAADFEPGRDYAEDEVNAVIGARYDDYCTVRRELVDDGVLERDKAAGAALRYRRVGAPGVAAMPAPGAGAAATPDHPGRTRKMENDTGAEPTVRPKTDRQRRKEWIELYKQARRTAGVYCIRNTVTGRVLLGSSVNLHGPFNRHRTELRLGSHRCPELQADWNRLGEDAFAFEVLDAVPAELAGLERDEALRQLEKKWLAAHQPLADRCYNTSEKIRVRQF